ncbi:FAD dependent oxidoreductase [Plectosphaerella plurivora]|uniref:FAD dependent oxidoreductase n=1 Tax=Plectosphaerella plurivora TaxID=936078 RepID=A0A9P8V1Q4_9PEZI|nr:FAD dependent oxidoreductase [Plectosphaerella plurivora]
MPLSKSDPIVIVGAGAFGLSTALRLVEAGFHDIAILEKDEAMPSRYSAANDLNKIVRAEYEDPWYTAVTLSKKTNTSKEAIRAWQTPLFAPHFHQTGFLHCVSGNASERAVSTLERFRAAAEVNPLIKKYVEPIDGPADIRQRTWQYNDGPLSGWKGYLNRLDGYAHSANALLGVAREVRDRGVKFFTGDSGSVVKLIHDKGGKCVGVETKTGTLSAKLVIVAAGAAAASLVPSCGRHVVAKSWSVAHVQLTDDEASALRGIPVTYARDLGFFFEPDPKTNLLKLCPMGGGYVNTDPKTGVSLAPSLAQSGFMPQEDQAQVRRLLAATLPALKDRPLVRQSLCWFADTGDSDFVIDYVPGTEGTVLLMSGDSGHGFKMFPIVGNWARDLLLAKDGKQPVERFRWKWTEGEAKSGAGDAADWGGSVSWRLGDTTEWRDLQDPRKQVSKL